MNKVGLKCTDPLDNTGIMEALPSGGDRFDGRLGDTQHDIRILHPLGYVHPHWKHDNIPARKQNQMSK